MCKQKLALNTQNDTRIGHETIQLIVKSITSIALKEQNLKDGLHDFDENLNYLQSPKNLTWNNNKTHETNSSHQNQMLIYKFCCRFGLYS